MPNKKMKDFIKEMEEQAFGCFVEYSKTKDRIWSIRFDTLMICLASAQNKKPNDIFNEFIEKYNILPTKFTSKDVKKAMDAYDYDNIETTATDYYDLIKDDKPKA